MQIPYAKIRSFIKTGKKMLLRKFITYISLLLTITLSASPARRGPVILTQPDGTSFIARFHGDEFTRIKTTADGHAIVQDEDGWWCYASYEPDGSKTSSGWRIGQDAPSDVIGKSINIPRRAIAQSASAKRLSIP